jgi:hypothetical protein
MVSESNNEVYRKKFVDLKELVAKENRLIQNDLNMIFQPINETSIATSDSREIENGKKSDANFKEIGKKFQEGQYEEIINMFRHDFAHRNESIKSAYLDYLAKSLVKLVNH